MERARQSGHKSVYTTLFRVYATACVEFTQLRAGGLKLHDLHNRTCRVYKTLYRVLHNCVPNTTGTLISSCHEQIFISIRLLMRRLRIRTPVPKNTRLCVELAPVYGVCTSACQEHTATCTCRVCTTASCVYLRDCVNT